MSTITLNDRFTKRSSAAQPIKLTVVNPQRKTRQPRKQKSKSTPKRRTSRPPRFPLSICAREYAASLANPMNGPLACIPSYPALETRKFRCYHRGTLTTSASSYGFVCADPLSFSANDQQAALTYSSPGYLGATIEGNPLVVGVTAGASNSDYVTADFAAVGNFDNVRQVSALLRVKYAGTNLNSGGTIYRLIEPNHTSLQAASINDFSLYLETVRDTIVPGKWYSLFYRPVTVNELSNFFTNQAFFGTPVAATKQAIANYYMGIQIVSAAASQPFIFEFWVTYEASGPTIRGKTPSHVDNIGLGNIQNVQSTPGYDTNAPGVLSQFLNSAGRYAAETLVNEGVNYGVGYGKYKVNEYLSGRKFDNSMIN